MLDLRAAHRLFSSHKTSPKSSKSTVLDPMEAHAVLEAGFDKQRDPELQKIELQLRKANVFFTLSSGHLYHKSNGNDVLQECETCVDTLNNMDYQLRVQPGVLSRQSFALKGKDGLVLQKLSNNLRIFFSV
jgi:hypothetical protein